MEKAVIATNRFGLGARSSEIEIASKDPKKWLIDSLAPITPPANAPTAIRMIRLWAKHKEQKQRIKQIQTEQIKKKGAEIIGDNEAMAEDSMVMAEGSMMAGSSQPSPEVSTYKVLSANSSLILQNAILANDSINWRLLDFFSNHFSVSASDIGLKFLAPTLEWDAIAPNLMGQFSTMLTAVASHPAMLYYLNNELSIGPNSKVGIKRKKRGLNENLAREILELHTLGVNGNYNQTDVIELAKAITGWSIAKPTKKAEFQAKDAFIYRELTHEPGSRKVYGNTYPESKIPTEQGRKILEDLARHPATAEHVCHKMAQHFISDNPPKKLVSIMKKAWLKSDGNLKSVVIAMIQSDLAWQSKAEKYKTPREFVISSYRAMSLNKPVSKKLLTVALKTLGQQPYQAGSPAGYGDKRADWDGADALYSRIEWSAKLAKLQRRQSIRKMTYNALGDQLSEHTRLIVKRAESHQQGISLLLMSPEFMYR